MTFHIDVARLAAHLFERAGSCIAAPAAALDVVAVPQGPAVGVLAAGLALRELLGQSPEGRQAMRDLGFEPVFHDVQGE